MFGSTFSGNYICMHFGNGDEEDYNVVNTFMTSLSGTFELFIFPGLPYGCVKMNEASSTILEKAIDSVHRCVQLKFSNNPRWVFFVPTLLSPEHFSKSAAIDMVDSVSSISASDITLLPKVLSADIISKALAYVSTQPWTKVAFRRVQFYGNEHIEASDYVKPTVAIPENIVEVLKRIMEEIGKEGAGEVFDTVTIAEIGAGQGIPISVESHIFDNVFALFYSTT